MSFARFHVHSSATLSADVSAYALADKDPFALMCTQTGFDIAKALPVGQLCKRHTEVLVETPKAFYIPLALVALYATPERVHWQVVGYLGKNELARIHA